MINNKDPIRLGGFKKNLRDLPLELRCFIGKQYNNAITTRWPEFVCISLLVWYFFCTLIAMKTEPKENMLNAALNRFVRNENTQ